MCDGQYLHGNYNWEAGESMEKLWYFLICQNILIVTSWAGEHAGSAACFGKMLGCCVLPEWQTGEDDIAVISAKKWLNALVSFCEVLESLVCLNLFS